MQTLKTQAVSFIQVFHSFEDRMKQLELEAELIAADRRKIQEDKERWVSLGVVVAGLGALVSFMLVPITYGVSITLFGTVSGAGSILVLPLTLIQKLMELENRGKMRRLTADFCLLLEPLRSALERIKSSCESLCSKSSDAEALKFTRLEVNILQIFHLMEKLRSSSSETGVLQKAEEVKKVASELGRMKTDLKTFYCPDRC